MDFVDIPVPQNRLPIQSNQIARQFGWRQLSGIAIAVDSYPIEPGTKWRSLAARICLISVVVVPLVVLGFMLRIGGMFFRRVGASRGLLDGFIGALTTSVLGIGTATSRRMIPVRDIRLRDGGGLEHLVRIKGDLIAGNITIGDELEVEGFVRHGTLMFRRGWNRRTRSKIIARVR